ncbi:hypothetical protein NZK35_19620 [Stieleria sp. ICT_E10.1]|nr:amylo-alpha-1,6-glucosidase [Stieleria sedimenti]MCS7468867.1 hypothetical protein [Stieleria sedimenti]
MWKRDAAYHQGTGWSWLIGPMVIAWCRTYPNSKRDAAAWLAGLESHLKEAYRSGSGQFYANKSLMIEPSRTRVIGRPVVLSYSNVGSIPRL